MFRYLFAFAIILLGTACAGNPLPEATPIPTPVVWRVQYSTEMRWMLPILNQCMRDQPRIGLALNEYNPLNSVSLSADFVFHWGDINPMSYSAYLLGMDKIKLAVNEMNSLDTISTAQVKAIFAGEFTKWKQLQVDGLGDIEVWIYPDDSHLQKAIREQLSSLDLNGLNALVAPDAEVMISQIMEDPDAVGLIPGAWQHAGIKFVDVEPESNSAKPGIPIVMLFRTALDQQQSLWIKCVQQSASFSLQK